jgi:tRNA1Val (adenine37-N6)-methyltransferase
MSNNYFIFKQFTVFQDKSAFKVGTDGVLLGAYAGVSEPQRILDIGTGTGLIALMMAQRFNASIVAIEPDEVSFAEACYNVSRSKWSGRIKVENYALQKYFPGDCSFDLIVTNPPYFIDSLKNDDPLKSKARHNVTLNNKDLLEGMERLLQEDGVLQLILPWTEGNVFIAEAREFGFYCNDILKIKPVPRGEVRRLILRFSRQKTRVTEKFLTIEKGNRHDFTDDYINLTKNFYLNF